jgi:hypothetical protein
MGFVSGKKHLRKMGLEKSANWRIQASENAAKPRQWQPTGRSGHIFFGPATSPQANRQVENNLPTSQQEGRKQPGGKTARHDKPAGHDNTAWRPTKPGRAGRAR